MKASTAVERKAQKCQALQVDVRVSRQEQVIVPEKLGTMAGSCPLGKGNVKERSALEMEVWELTTYKFSL